MKFNEESLLNFLKDIPFFKNNDCFCLGNSLEEAGCIIKEIINTKANTEGENFNVGMVSE